MKVSAQLKAKHGMRKVVAQKQAELDKRVEKALALNANRVRNNAILLLKTITPGETQIRYGGAKGRRKVVASPPGAAPNPDTKLAVKSVLMELDARNNVARVGTNLKYLAALEFASRKTKRAARPWLRPAWKQWFKKHGKDFVRDIGVKRG